jgi:PAS domain S-box-containing protein
MTVANSKSKANEIQVSGIHMAWNPQRGTCTFEKMPVAMMWVDTTLAGLMSGIQAMVGTERFLLALQSEGRKSVEADWKVIVQFPNFPEGFKAIANIAAVAGWGEWLLVSLDKEKKECRFRVADSWEGRYQRALGVCWGSGVLAGKMAGYCTKLFGTNCWADQTAFIARGDAFDEFEVRPSARSLETEIENLLTSDEATRADMAAALQRLKKEIRGREEADKYIAHLSTFPQLNPNPIMEIDLSGKITFYNAATLNILAHLGESGNFEAFLPRDMATILQKARETGKKEFKREVTIADSYFEEYISFPEGLNGARIYAWDITARKQTEKALRQSEEEVKSILLAAPIGIGVVTNRTIQTINDRLCEMVGYHREELIDQNARILYPSDEEYHRVGKEKYQQIGVKGTGTVETLWQRKNGTVINVLLSSTPIDMHDLGKGVTFTALDITERKQTEEKLHQAQRMEAIGTLAGGLAHDFNNLLTAIMGYSEIMMMGLHKEDPFYSYIEEIIKASNRGASLTNQLLAFSRRQIFQPRVINLNDVVIDVEKMLRRLIGDDIELTTFVSQELGLVKADPGQIEQIIMNLVVNARDAMPQGGIVTLETANASLDESYARGHVGVTPGPYVMLSVSDNGLGMDAGILSHMFEPFFTTKEIGKGTGLGLSTVYGITKQSGGHIWVYSEPGKGTTVKVYLPRVEGSLEMVKPEAPLPTSLQGNETILLVEDNAEVRALVSMSLRKHGFVVLEAGQGDEALLLCEREKTPIHLLLTDVVLPKVSGSVLADQLRLLHPEMKILFMSGYTKNAIAHHGVLNSDINFIAKPFKVLALVQKIREVLNAH